MSQKKRRMVGPGALLLGAALVAGCQFSRPATAPSWEEVNIGYQMQSRQNITGSISSMTAEDIAPMHSARLAELFEGRFPGVRASTAPGGGLQVRIRGVATLMGGSDPLYVIDGMPVRVIPGQGLLGVDPQDIARIDILKDAGSTAIYGSRGANGVVLITTKRAYD